LTKPRLGELVAALSGLGLLAVSLAPWYETPAGSLTAWEAFDVTDVVMALAIACAVLIACVDWFRISVSLPVAGSATTALFTAIALLLVLLRLLNPPGGDGVEREPALYAGLGCLAVMFVAAIVGMMEDHPPKPLTPPGSPATTEGPS
jgi:hypothetical protein